MKLFTTLFLLILAGCMGQNGSIDDSFNPGLVEATTPDNLADITISSVTAPGGGLIHRGINPSISFNVIFNSPVVVENTPRIKIKIGSKDRWAIYNSGSNTSTLTFQYNLVNNDFDLDGVEAIGPEVDLNGGSIHSTLDNQQVNLSFEDIIFENLKITLPNMVTWLDASDLDTMYLASTCTGELSSLNSSVGCIRDKSGRNNHATQVAAGNKPTLKNNAFAGMTSLELDGAGDIMEIQNGSDFQNVDEISIFVVIRPNRNGTTPQGILSKRDSQANVTIALFLYTFDLFYYDAGSNGANRRTSTTNFNVGSEYLFTYVYRGANPLAEKNRLYFNSLLEHLESNSFTVLTNTTANITIGTLNVGYATTLEANIAEIIIFKRSLDPAAGEEIDVVNQYLTQKWGL